MEILTRILVYICIFPPWTNINWREWRFRERNIHLPIFALANTAIVMNGNLTEVVTENYSLGVALGLVIGKPIGIFLLTFLTVKIGWCQLPSDMNWKSFLGVGFLGGIGFTMSIFITLLAFDTPEIINNTKLIIVFSSLIAGIVGFLFLKTTLNQQQEA